MRGRSGGGPGRVRDGGGRALRNRNRNRKRSRSRVGLRGVVDRAERASGAPLEQDPAGGDQGEVGGRDTDDGEQYVVDVEHVPGRPRGEELQCRGQQGRGAGGAQEGREPGGPEPAAGEREEDAERGGQQQLAEQLARGGEAERGQWRQVGVVDPGHRQRSQYQPAQQQQVEGEAEPSHRP